MTKRSKLRRLRHRVYRGPASAAARVPPGELLLEFFTDQQLLQWRARGKDYQSYHYLWYYELEAQRAANQAVLLESLSKVPGCDVDISGWGRALQYRYSNTPLSCFGSMKWLGGRFNYGVDIDSARFAAFPALYLAESFETGLREMQGLTREDDRGGLSASELNLCAKHGVAWVPIKGTVSNVFDLTKVSNLDGFAKAISTFKLSKAVRDTEKQIRVTPMRITGTPQELLGTFMAENWREFPAVWNTPANPQLFGHLLTQAGFEGVLFSSTRTGEKNLAIFTRQFKNSASSISACNPPDNATCCELNAETYRDLERDHAGSSQ